MPERVKCGKPALFDMDTSLFNYEQAMRRDLEKLASPGEEYNYDDIWSLDELPHMKARMSLIKAKPGWWRALEPIQMGFKVWHEARRIGYDMWVLTKGPWTHTAAWSEKLECCQAYLGNDIDVDITTDKSGSYGYFLYDDYQPYIEAWLKHRPRGWGIMPVTPLNKSFQHPRVIKYNGTNFNVVAEKLQELFDRKRGEE